jgi:L-ascorbate metabolism protein UlaG (beta-lactamase superfamily)
MKCQATTTTLVISLLLVLNGCSSYIQRIVVQSIGKVADPIPPAPYMITTPILPGAQLAVSWVGHSTVLIQMCDKLIVTDPFFTNTIGLIARRSVHPGLDPKSLPRVDLTLVSHIHFDHLNYGSLDMLPKGGELVIPEGALQYTPDLGFKDVDELKPWELLERGEVRITAVPVQHFTGRYGFDGAWLGTLGYTGYVIEYRGFVVFFTGDTGYNPEFFKEIGRRFKIDVAIVPIAPGGGSGIGGRVHASPLGALTIFKEVGAKYLLPVHYGTLFYGSDANPTEAIDRLREAAAKEGVVDKVIALEMGQQKVIY